MKNDGYFSLLKVYQLCMEEKTVEMRGESVTSSIGDDYQKWSFKTPIFIDAPTGTGKTSFVYDVLIPDAISKKQTVLLVSNRLALSAQQKRVVAGAVRQRDVSFDFPQNSSDEEVRKTRFFWPVCITTYQGLRSLVRNANWKEQYFFQNLGYAIFDEAHFFYSDAFFNEYCSSLLDWIPEIFWKTVRIYMTATGWDVKECILNSEKNALSRQERDEHAHRFSGQELNLIYYAKAVTGEKRSYSFINYHMDAKYDRYNLHFLDNRPKRQTSSADDDAAEEDPAKKYLHTLVDTMKPLPSPENKWIVFVYSKRDGKTLKGLLEKKGVEVAYIDADNKKSEDTLNRIIAKESFEESVLIATSVIDCGVNIVDTNVHNIAIFATDRTELTQMIGRKRLQPGETVDLWVYVPSWHALRAKEKGYIHDIMLAYRLEIAKQMLSRTSDSSEHLLAQREVWAERKQICVEPLFYINSHGLLDCNVYVMGLVQKRIEFLRQFTRKDNPLNFKEVVAEWLGKSDLLKAQREKQLDELQALLEESVSKGIPEEGIANLREQILKTAEALDIEVAHKNRKDSFSPITLNPVLQKLGLDFSLMKKANVWTVEKKLQTK